MKLRELTKDNPEVAIKLNDLATKAGITKDEARFCFIWLLEEVFASGNWIHNGVDANIQITVKGSDEATRLSMPWLGRILLAKEGVWFTIITGSIAGAIGGAAVLFLQMLLKQS